MTRRKTLPNELSVSPPAGSRQTAPSAWSRSSLDAYKPVLVMNHVRGIVDTEGARDPDGAGVRGAAAGVLRQGAQGGADLAWRPSARLFAPASSVSYRAPALVRLE